MTERHLTDTELAERIGKSRYFVQDQCKAELWPHLRVGKSYRFTAEHVAYIDGLLEVKAKAPVAAPENAWGVKGKGKSR